MKCTVCGREFGNGVKCQSCGTDRVTGLANYSGYETPTNISYNKTTVDNTFSHSEQKVVSQSKAVTVGSMICYNCGEIIPADSKFCPHCSTSLYVTCPKCGHEYSSQYPACGQCGTNRKAFLEEKRRLEEWQRETERQRKQQEEERKKAERQRAEIERKKYEEWLKTPEGQIEKDLKKKAKEIKEQCRAQCESEKTSNILGGTFMIPIPIILLFWFMGKGRGDMGAALLMVGALLGSAAIGIIGIWKLIKGLFSSPDDYVAEYKSKHSKEPVTKYL